MAGLAGLGLFISGLGIFAIYRTILLGQEANAINRDTAKRELRAYVGIVDHNITPPSMPDNPGSVTINMKNFGQTSALRLTTQFSIGTSP